MIYIAPKSQKRIRAHRLTQGDYCSKLFYYAQHDLRQLLQGVSTACYASPVLAIVGMSVCLSVTPRH